MQQQGSSQNSLRQMSYLVRNMLIIFDIGVSRRLRLKKSFADIERVSHEIPCMEKDNAATAVKMIWVSISVYIY